jgi:alkanesulfonate monooxygenase SsuD/methylene tetrahydromethanopterin reductase-like flavin-dependent oxidoreductase (luciferase family)
VFCRTTQVRRRLADGALFHRQSVYNDALLFASAVAMRTERIRIGFAVVQLPFHHPVRLAVQLALLDNLSKGRIDVGVGKGTITTSTNLSATDYAAATAVSTWRRRLWSGGPVTYSGKYFQVQVPELRPRPVQLPHLPLWHSVISPAWFNECGRLGVPILTARLPVDPAVNGRGATVSRRRAQRDRRAALRLYCRSPCGPDAEQSRVA